MSVGARTFRKAVFNGDRRHGAGQYPDLQFVGCTFGGCTLLAGPDPRERPVVRHVRLVQCVTNGSAISGAVLEDVDVDGLKVGSLLFVSGCAFRHVVIRGRIGPVMIQDALYGPLPGSPEQIAYDAANAAFYRDVDWALDISEAEFEDVKLVGVPPRLIRRDPATQAIVKRERLLDGSWQLDGLHPIWRILMRDITDRHEDEGILVVPRRSRKAAELLRDLDRLRTAGIVEPDGCSGCVREMDHMMGRRPIGTLWKPRSTLKMLRTA